ncbi:MAG: CHC2 zinc finger domain-containing protein [Clostridia bacterium]
MSRIDTTDLKSRFDFEGYVAARVKGLKKSGSQHICLCPFHDDNTQSASVDFDNHLFNCFACGSAFDSIGFVMAYENCDFHRAVEIMGGADSEFRLIEPRKITFKEKEVTYTPVRGDIRTCLDYENPKDKHSPWKFAAEYVYIPDKLVKIRYESSKSNKKTFRTYHKQDDGKWYYGKGDNVFPLYAPNGYDSDTIIFVEGEKDVDSLIDIGYTAVCTAFGATEDARQLDKDDIENLREKLVVVIPDDNDKADDIGGKYARAVANKLIFNGVTARVFNLTELNTENIHGYDITDAIEQHGDVFIADKLEKFIKELPENQTELVPVKSYGYTQEQDLQIELIASTLAKHNNDWTQCLPQDTAMRELAKELNCALPALRKTIERRAEEIRKEHNVFLAKSNVKNTIVEIDKIARSINIKGSGYIVAENGMIVTDEGEIVCKQIMLPVAEVQDIDGSRIDGSHVMLAYVPIDDSNIHLGQFPASSLSLTNDLIRTLSTCGLSVNSQNSGAVMEYIDNIRNWYKQNGQTRIFKSANRLGWIKQGEPIFLPYEYDPLTMIYGTGVEKNTISKMTATAGEREESRKLIKETCKATNVMTTIIGATVASLLLGYCDTNGEMQGFAFNVYHKSGTGKSVMTEVAASMFGSGQFVNGWFGIADATLASDKGRNAYYYNMPLFVDDIVRKRGEFNVPVTELPRRKTRYIMGVTGGEGRSRLNQAGEFREVGNWCNVVILTNEDRMVEDTMDGGAFSRCLEVQHTDYLSEQTLTDWVNRFSEHYGHFPLDIINQIRTKTPEEWRAEISFWTNMYIALGVTGKRALYASYIQTGYKIAKEAVDIGTEFDTDWFAKEIKSVGEVDDGARAYIKILDWISTHTEYLRAEVDKNGITVGSLNYDKQGNKVASIPVAELTKVCNQYNINRQSLINYAYETDKAVRAYDENDKAAPVRVQIRDAEIRCIQFYYEWLNKMVEYDESADYNYKRSWYGSGV